MLANVVATEAAGRASIHESTWPETAESFQQLCERHEPTVFRGLASDWLPEEATGRPLQWMASIVGHRRVPVTVVLPNDNGFVGTGGMKRLERVSSKIGGRRTFSSVASSMENASASRDGYKLYVQSVAVETELPELQPYIKLPLDKLRFKGEWRAWIGTGDHHVAMHFDGRENFFCLLAGRKRFSVCPFDVLADAYVGPMEGNEYGTPASTVDPKRPDFSQFPRFRRILDRTVSVDLCAGDVLYLPSHWWHWVDSFDVNISVNYWFVDLADHSVRHAAATFFRALLNLRGLPDHWRHYWKTTFDYYVFQTHGDPYSHLPFDEQGFAGTPTAERFQCIRGMIRTAEAQPSALDSSSTEVVMNTTYRLSPAVSIRLGSQSTVVFSDPNTGAEAAVPAAFLAVAAQFVEGQTPAAVFESFKRAGLSVDPRFFLEPVQQLASASILRRVE